jgi:O-antigen ligase
VIGPVTTPREAIRGERPVLSERQSSDGPAGRRRLTPELIALAVLFLLTAAFGREFSKLELGPSWLHPTEVVLAAVLVAAVIRTGPAGALDRIRAMSVAVPLLVVLWVFGAIAALRGLSGWGFSDVLYDIGLVEYSVLAPLLVLVVRDRSDLMWLSGVVAIGGVLSIAVQAAEAWSPSDWDFEGTLGLIEVASGLYVCVYAAWIAARLAAGRSVAWWHFPVLVLGVALTIAGGSRAAWVGLLVAFAVVVLLAPAGRRVLSTGFATATLLLGVVASLPVESAESPRVVREVGKSLDESNQENANARWRIAYWRWVVEESAGAPAFGVGFGRPSNFHWEGHIYDHRTGEPGRLFNVTPPHNSFLNLLYRTGLPGLLALAVLMFVAVRRLLPVTLRAHDEDRAIAVFLLAALAAITAIACFAVVLEGPYMGMFFWAVLGLILVAPGMLAHRRARVATRQPPPTPSESSRSCAGAPL